MLLNPIRSTISRIQSPLRRQTNVDREMLGYAKQAVQEEEQKQKRFQPLQFVLDLLQRGQYLTANMADEIEESFRTGRPLGESTLQVLKSAWEGITGERKGDWETLLFGGRIEGTSEQAGERAGWIPGEWGDDPLIKWGQEGSSGVAEGILRPRKLIGLAANVALDPTTYISFGSTKAAQIAARKYADDVVRLTLATMGPDDFAKLSVKVNDVASKSTDEILKIIKNSTKASRHFDDIYKDAFKTALRNPEQHLLKEITPRYEQLIAPPVEREIIEALPKGGFSPKVVTDPNLLSQRGLGELAKSVEGGYAGAGTRAMKFFGTQKFVGERYPSVLRQWDIFQKKFGETAAGKTIGNAWWAIMNTGPVGAIRKALGFRNPYQQMLHLEQRRSERAIHALAEQEEQKVAQIAASLPDDVLNKAANARIKAEEIAHDMGLYDLKDYKPIPSDSRIIVTPEWKYQLLNNKKTDFFEVDEIEEYLNKMFSDMRYPSEARQHIKISLGPDEPDSEFISLIAAKIGVPKEKVPQSVVGSIRAANDIAQKYGFKDIGSYLNAKKRGHFLSSDMGGFGANVQNIYQGTTITTMPNDAPDVFGAIRNRMAQDPTEIPIVENLLNDQQFLDSLNIGPDEVDDIRKVWQQLDTVSKQWWDKEHQITLEAGQEWHKVPRLNFFPRNVGTGKIESGTIGKKGPVKTAIGGITNEKKITIAQSIKNNANVFKFVMGDDLKKAWDDLPLIDGTKIDFNEFVENFVRDHGFTEANLDLKEAFQLRAIAHAKYMGRMQMIKDFRQFGISIDEVLTFRPELNRALNTTGEAIPEMGLFKAENPAFEGLLFDRDVVNVINKVSEITSSDESVRQFATMFARATSWWKGMVTMTPGFHWRNAISNNITGFLRYGPRWFTDVKKIEQSIIGTQYLLNPDKFVDMLTGQLKMSKERIVNVMNSRVGDSPFTLQELADWMRGAGATGGRQIEEEIGEKAGTTLNPFSTKFKGFDISRKIGNVVEGQAKFLSFLHEYDDVARAGGEVGQSIAERLAGQKRYLEYADEQMNKWFIDYGDLTEFEKKVLKPVIPFFSWLRHNLANQIAGITLYPNMYSLIPKVRGAMKDDEDFDYSLLPDYMENLGYYPMGKTAGGETIMRWANIPLEDINKIPLLFEGNRPIPNLSIKEFANDVIANSHPLIKSVIEVASGKDLFRQRDIKGLERAPALFQYLNKAPRVVEFLDGMLRKAGVREGLKIVPTADGTELKINGTVARLLENNMPVLKAIETMIETPETLAELASPNVETWINRITGKKDYYEGLNEIFSLVSKMFGWKFKGIVEAEEEERRNETLMRRAEELKAEARKQLPGYQKRREKAIRARQKRVQRYF